MEDIKGDKIPGERPRWEPKLDFTPRQIYDEMSRFVIGQERAVRTIAIAAYNHIKRIIHPNDLLKKSNVLMVGPTGSGKTHIARTLAGALNVPFTVTNATDYTEAGYYGKDVEVMVAELLFATGGDVRAAERGIIFIDEIDKIARRSGGQRTGASGRDIGGEGVQQAILKLLEANRVFVPLNVTQHWNKHDFVPMEVGNILFICAGTFSDMKRGRDRGDIGFLGESADDKSTYPVAVRDLESYGLLAELLGRLPVIVELDPLTDDELMHIVTDPPDSLLREYQAMFEYEQITIEMCDDGLRAIAAKARERGTGARGLRAMFEEMFHDLAFTAPERMGENVVVDADFVNANLVEAKKPRRREAED
ncbi:MAG: AAA family ATPase [Deltaproteobacteria bacterium]|nr:AAA family ATPase [Deltaproteobacteria bacterium]MCB9489218.1 AAA family ATPase [Deltaproteobacteria bacterium]